MTESGSVPSVKCTPNWLAMFPAVEGGAADGISGGEPDGEDIGNVPEAQLLPGDHQCACGDASRETAPEHESAAAQQRVPAVRERGIVQLRADDESDERRGDD